MITKNISVEDWRQITCQVDFCIPSNILLVVPTSSGCTGMQFSTVNTDEKKVIEVCELFVIVICVITIFLRKPTNTTSVGLFFLLFT